MALAYRPHVSPSRSQGALGLWQPAQLQSHARHFVVTPPKSPAHRSTSQPGTTQLLPQAQAAVSCQLGAMLSSEKGKAAPVSQAGCDAPGDAGSCAPAQQEIRLYEQNRGGFPLQRRDRSPRASIGVTASSGRPGAGLGNKSLPQLHPKRGGGDFSVRTVTSQCHPRQKES